MDDAETVIDLKREIKRCSDCDQRFGAEATFCPFDGTRLGMASWDPSGDALLGTVIDGRYEVCSVLGEGGMGTVYRVRHTTLDRHFAMKVLRKDLAREGDLAARFIQEAKATASIKHPNVVAITDFGHLVDETPYFVMDLLSGQPLSVAIKAAGPLDSALAVQVILKVAAALGAAHDVGIVHRDLKPENVFLVSSATGGPADDVRIVDFGAAKVIGASRLTKTGIVFGTPHYMSPEQASGEEVDHRTDVYALGVIMYEMFTGRVPFQADTYMGVLTQHMFVNPAPPSQVAPERAAELGALEDVTMRALGKKADDRFASMHDLRREVERLVRFDEHGKLRVAAAGKSAVSKTPRAPLRNLALPMDEEVDAIVDKHPRTLRRTLGFIALAMLACGVGLIAWSRGSAPPDEASSSVITSATASAALGTGRPPRSSGAPIIPAPQALPSAAPEATAVIAPAPDPARSGADLAQKTERANAPAAVPRGMTPSARAPIPQSSATAAKPTPTSLGSDFDDPWKK